MNKDIERFHAKHYMTVTLTALDGDTGWPLCGVDNGTDVSNGDGGHRSLVRLVCCPWWTIALAIKHSIHPVLPCL